MIKDPTMKSEIILPKNLKLGVATAATQIEGGLKNHSWYDWCQRGKISDKSSCFRANDHWHRFKEDIDLMASLNIQIYRLGLEWSRIEPSEGTFDDSALFHYREELIYLISKGIEPLITLHHFTNPMWFEKMGAFEHKRNVAYFIRYCSKVIEVLGDLCAEWITLNEPNVYTTNGYIFGTWPPGKKNFFKAMSVYRNMTRCHLEAYQLIHELRKKANDIGPTRVGFANHFRIFNPLNMHSLFDRFGSYMMEYLFQTALTHSLSTGQFVLPFGLGSPYGKGKFYDFIGINYYSRSTFKGFKEGVMPHTQRNDLNWEIYPQGLSLIIKHLYKRYHAPIWITENGTADAKDAFRSEYLLSHLVQISNCISEDIPVERYYHWTFIDNFEWAEGESARFGLVELDFETQKRTPRKSGKLYQKIIIERHFSIK